MLKVDFNALSLQLDTTLAKLRLYLQKNSILLWALAIVALSTYGFELFNLNLTTDEELHANLLTPTAWLSQGRWGMYILNQFIMPYTVIPFVPLFVALIFHVAAALLILESWKVTSWFDQFAVGAIFVSFPTTAFMYTFSTINYGIGVGLFCIALALYIYSKNDGRKRLLAILPAAFTISIYQGFIPALAVIFLIHIIYLQIYTDKPIIIDMLFLSCISVLSFALYYVIQKLILITGVAPSLTYVFDYLDLGFLQHYFYIMLNRMWYQLFLPIYLGDAAVYSISLRSLILLLGISFLGLFLNLLRSKRSAIHKLFVLLLLSILLILPFIAGFLTQGLVGFRTLIAVPLVISGIVMLGMLGSSKNFKLLAALIALYSILQFVTSTNHLFASSHLALEADRVLAARLITRIEEVQKTTNIQKLEYVEIIGYYSRPSTQLIPKIETFGLSFFEVGGGVPERISSFLHIVGFERLQPIPLARRAQLVEIGRSMPIWPALDSVKIIDNIVLIKFGPYSPGQKASICSSKETRSHLYDKTFCR